MERGTFSLDAMFDRAADWCLAHLPIEPVWLGREHREVNAIDSSSDARKTLSTENLAYLQGIDDSSPLSKRV